MVVGLGFELYCLYSGVVVFTTAISLKQYLEQLQMTKPPRAREPTFYDPRVERSMWNEGSLGNRSARYVYFLLL